MPILRFLSRKKNKLKKVVNPDKSHTVIPKHVAIIMDGNGRWAKAKGYPRFRGHKQGMENVQQVVRTANKNGINVLTLYAFSTENWKRPKKEVEYLMKLPKEFLNVYLPELIEQNVQVRTMGHFDDLPQHTKDAVQYAINRTKANTGLILNIALNYGSRSEMVHAARRIAIKAANQEIAIDDIDEKVFEEHLFTNALPDPDLLIRTSGEIRLSNFLLWQLAYSEFWFTDVHWPDFTETIFEQALTDYACRKRRFGALSEEEES